MAGYPQTDGEMVQGAMDMLIRRTPVTAPAHGHTIAYVVEHTSESGLTAGTNCWRLAVAATGRLLGEAAE